MAQFKTYKCEKCGYSVLTEPLGHYGLMSGEYYNFKCSCCKEIVSISAEELAKERYFIKCPKCHKEDKLSTWNPIEGKCPKCGGNMVVDNSEGITMAD